MIKLSARVLPESQQLVRAASRTRADKLACDARQTLARVNVTSNAVIAIRASAFAAPGGPVRMPTRAPSACVREPCGQHSRDQARCLLRLLSHLKSARDFLSGQPRRATSSARVVSTIGGAAQGRLLLVPSPRGVGGSGRQLPRSLGVRESTPDGSQDVSAL